MKKEVQLEPQHTTNITKAPVKTITTRQEVQRAPVVDN